MDGRVVAGLAVAGLVAVLMSRRGAVVLVALTPRRLKPLTRALAAVAAWVAMLHRCCLVWSQGPHVRVSWYRIRLAWRLTPGRWDTMAANLRIGNPEGETLRVLKVRGTLHGVRVKLAIPAGWSHEHLSAWTHDKRVEAESVFRAHLGQTQECLLRFVPDAARTDRAWLQMLTSDPIPGAVPWNEPLGPVSFADPVVMSLSAFGDPVSISMKNRIGIFGTSGTGKSCLQRVLSAHVIAAVDADLEVWDLKMGLESQHYEGLAHRVTTIKDAISRVYWLKNEEFPRRAAIMKERKISAWEESEEDPALVVLIDEGNVVTRGFAAYIFNEFLTAVEQGRALGVFFIWATQFPLAVNLPTSLRSQLNIRICFQLMSSEESKVVFKDEVDEGWEPHKLPGIGWCFVKSAAHRDPDESKCLWIGEAQFRESLAVHRNASLLLCGTAEQDQEDFTEQVPEQTEESRRTLTELEQGVLDTLQESTEPMSGNAIARALGKKGAQGVINALKREPLVSVVQDTNAGWVLVVPQDILEESGEAA